MQEALDKLKAEPASGTKDVGDPIHSQIADQVSLGRFFS